MSDFDRDLYVFAAGAAAMREYLAKFVEYRGEHSTATSLRLNWNPAWGDDPKSTISTPVVEIVDPSGNVSYRRPLGDPLIAEARRVSGYSVRMVADVLVPPTLDERPSGGAEDTEYFRQKVIEQAGIPANDGHEWSLPDATVGHEYCRRCLKVRRADGRNPPCDGPSGLSLRTEIAGSTEGWTGKRCPTCKGMGDVFDHEHQEDVPCPSCGGTGDEYATRAVEKAVEQVEAELDGSAVPNRLELWMDPMKAGDPLHRRCGKRFEAASGEMTTPCELPAGHEGNCRGFILGSPTSWPGHFASEREMVQVYRELSMRPVMEQIQQDMSSGVMGLLNTPPDLPVPPCRVCGKSEDILIYDREKLEQNICPACCGKAEHPDGETGHRFTERDIDGPYCTYCGLRRECVEWHADDE